MKLYFAGAFSGLPIEQLKSFGMKYKLYSYANEKNSAIEWGGEGLMLDSGAFSVFTKGITIEIPDLVGFIQEYKPEAAIQLDVIGDEDATWKNYIKMSKLAECLPVAHYKSSKKHLRRVFEASDYICLGGLVPLARQRKVLHQWLDYVFSFPFVRRKKIHCLGIMTKSVLEKYPFYSCDSSSALSSQRYP
jgi:hypothetical protein